MAQAICISCGRPKRAGWKRCRHCGFHPGNEEAGLVRSIYLSVDRFDEEEDRRRYARELDQIGRQIEDGKEIMYDAAELSRLLEEKRAVEDVSNWAVLRVIVVILLPVILLLLAVYLLRFLP